MVRTKSNETLSNPIEAASALCYVFLLRGAADLLLPVPAHDLRQEDCWMATQVRDTLLAQNDEFRKLVTEHSQYSQRLDSLTQKRFLSEDEKIEEVRLKKLKLRLKDQMERLEQEFRRVNNVA